MSVIFPHETVTASENLIPLMPNGKSFIDCRYCVYAWPQDEERPILFGSRIFCKYHQKALPQPSSDAEHRFLINIIANETWFSEQCGSHIFNPFLRQVARFGKELWPGVLYEYVCQQPETLKELVKLREPDYQTRSWKAEDSR